VKRQLAAHRSRRRRLTPRAGTPRYFTLIITAVVEGDLHLVAHAHTGQVLLVVDLETGRAAVFGEDGHGRGLGVDGLDRHRRRLLLRDGAAGLRARARVTFAAWSPAPNPAAGLRIT
jgi:hypothetical protein